MSALSGANFPWPEAGSLVKARFWAPDSPSICRFFLRSGASPPKASTSTRMATPSHRGNPLLGAGARVAAPGVALVSVVVADGGAAGGAEGMPVVLAGSAVAVGAGAGAAGALAASVEALGLASGVASGAAVP